MLWLWNIHKVSNNCEYLGLITLVIRLEIYGRNCLDEIWVFFFCFWTEKKTTISFPLNSALRVRLKQDLSTATNANEVVFSTSDY